MKCWVCWQKMWLVDVDEKKGKEWWRCPNGHFMDCRVDEWWCYMCEELHDYECPKAVDYWQEKELLERSNGRGLIWGDDSG